MVIADTRSHHISNTFWSQVRSSRVAVAELESSTRILLMILAKCKDFGSDWSQYQNVSEQSGKWIPNDSFIARRGEIKLYWTYFLKIWKQLLLTSLRKSASRPEVPSCNKRNTNDTALKGRRGAVGDRKMSLKWKHNRQNRWLESLSEKWTLITVQTVQKCWHYHLSTDVGMKRKNPENCEKEEELIKN